MRSAPYPGSRGSRPGPIGVAIPHANRPSTRDPGAGNCTAPPRSSTPKAPIRTSSTCWSASRTEPTSRSPPSTTSSSASRRAPARSTRRRSPAPSRSRASWPPIWPSAATRSPRSRTSSCASPSARYRRPPARAGHGVAHAQRRRGLVGRGAAEQALDERRAFARHPRAGDDQVEGGRVRAVASLGVDVRVDADRTRRAPSGAQAFDQRRSRRAASARSTIITSPPARVGAARRPARPRARPPAASRARCEPSSRSSKTPRRAPSLRAQAAELLRGTDSGRPQSWMTSTRPSRTSRSASSPAIPASSSSFSVPWTTGAAAAWPNWCATMMPQVPVVARVRLRVAGHEQRRGVDVAVLFDAQVELEVGPVGRQRVENLLEGFGKRHDAAAERTAMDDPARPGRAARVARALDGAEEVAVVRAALSAGVPRERVLDELQREVERRLARLDERTNRFVECREHVRRRSLRARQARADRRRGQGRSCTAR